MNDELLTVLAHARIEAMLREARVYRMLAEGSLPSRPVPLRALRAALAAGLMWLARTIAPDGPSARPQTSPKW